MNINTISNRLVALLKEKRFTDAQQELFHDDVISIEPDFHPQQITKGLSNILQKEKEFLKNIASWEKFEVSEPVVSENHFCIRMYSKFSTVNAKEMEIDELIVYQVEVNKIVKEQFFYRAPEV